MSERLEKLSRLYDSRQNYMNDAHQRLMLETAELKSEEDRARNQAEQDKRRGKIAGLLTGGLQGAVAGSPAGPWGAVAGGVVGAGAGYMTGGKSNAAVGNAGLLYAKLLEQKQSELEALKQPQGQVPVLADYSQSLVVDPATTYPQSYHEELAHRGDMDQYTGGQNNNNILTDPYK